jgi:hypothetical protein
MKEYRHCQPLHNTQRKRGREGRRAGDWQREEQRWSEEGEKERCWGEGKRGRQHTKRGYKKSRKCWLYPSVTVWNHFRDSKYVLTVWFAHDERYNKVRQLYNQHSLLDFNQPRLLQSSDRAGDEGVVETFSHLFHHYT